MPLNTSKTFSLKIEQIALEKNIAAFQVTKEKICKVNKNNPHGYAEFRYYRNTFKEFKVSTCFSK